MSHNLYQQPVLVDTRQRRKNGGARRNSRSENHERQAARLFFPSFEKTAIDRNSTFRLLCGDRRLSCGKQKRDDAGNKKNERRRNNRRKQKNDSYKEPVTLRVMFVPSLFFYQIEYAIMSLRRN